MNTFKNSWIQSLLLVISSSVLMLFTAVFGAYPLLKARKNHGRWPFWFAGLLGAAALSFAGWTYGVPLMMLTVLVGVYEEGKEAGWTEFAAGAVGLLISVGLGAALVGAWMSAHDMGLVEALRTELQTAVTQLKTVQPSFTLDAEVVIQQTPSAVAILLMLNLWVALVLESWTQSKAAAEKSESEPQKPLVSFRLPDTFVWLLIATLGLMVMDYKHGNYKVLWLNSINILILCFFFQGIAVVASYFRKAKVGQVWQVLWYFVLVVQMFLLVSLVGVADYWLDFRARMIKNSAETT